jgi:DNA-binding MarR family transcriptional regulator
MEPVEQLMVSLQRLGRLQSSRQVTNRIATAAGAEVSQQGVTLLRVLHRNGRQSMATLASAAAMDLGAVSRQVKLLEEAGAVRRTRSAEDGRVALLELTAEGRRVAERIRAVGVRHLESALAAWSPADAETLATLLARLVDDLMSTPVPVSRSARTARPAART